MRIKKMKDYYYILGIVSDASEDEIKKAYRKLSVKFHPDKNEGDIFFENRFKEIQEAYDTLSNKNQRILYDSAFKNNRTKEKYQHTESKKEEAGEIISFEVSKKNIVDDEEVTFFWATKNVTRVELSCFNEVLPTIGKKTLRINTPTTKSITITLKAFDTNGTALTKMLTINYNKKYDEKTNEDKPVTYNILTQTKRDPSSNNLKHIIWILVPILLFTLVFAISNQSKSKSINQNLIDELFDVKEFITDSSAICFIDKNYFEEDDYLGEVSDKATFHITLKEINTIIFDNINYKYVMFETIPTKLEGGVWKFCENEWCTGYISIARYALQNNSYKLQEFNINCDCGKNDIQRLVEIPRITNIENKYLVLDAKRESTHTYNCVDCENTAQICNALDLKKSKAFSLGGTRYTKADFDLEKISYVIHNGIPFIKSNGGIKPYYEIEEIFNAEDKINIKPSDINLANL